jgi:hypothetical protein
LALFVDIVVERDPRECVNIAVAMGCSVRAYLMGDAVLKGEAALEPVLDLALPVRGT